MSRFSDAPLGHYFFATCVTGLAETSHFALATYQCLGISHTSECGWTAANLIARSQPGADALSTFGSVLAVSGLQGLALIVSFLLLNAPAYALAWYVSYRYRIRRNLFGFAFWIGVWALAFFSLACVGGLVNPRYLTWVSTEHVELKFTVLGLLCGMAYCAFAVLDGNDAAAD